MATASPHFTPKLFKFMRELAANNDREWFKARKDRYEREVRDPLLSFIAEFGPRLQKITRHVVADPRPVGGSLFRIHRDTRFGKDKSPYKTHAAAQFRHTKGRDVHAPGFYLHLEPGSVFMGAGVWRPDGPSVGAIREAIAGDSGRWKRITCAKAFRETFRMEGESLKRPPRGFDPEHELVLDLKRKDFILVADFTQKEVCDKGFLTLFTKRCRSAAPFMRFLADALDLPW